MPASPGPGCPFARGGRLTPPLPPPPPLLLQVAGDVLCSIKAMRVDGRCGDFPITMSRSLVRSFKPLLRGRIDIEEDDDHYEEA